MHPREWNRDVQFRGRVRVQIKQDDGSFCQEKFSSRKSHSAVLAEPFNFCCVTFKCLSTENPSTEDTSAAATCDLMGLPWSTQRPVSVWVPLPDWKIRFVMSRSVVSGCVRHVTRCEHQSYPVYRDDDDSLSVTMSFFLKAQIRKWFKTSVYQRLIVASQLFCVWPTLSVYTHVLWLYKVKFWDVTVVKTDLHMSLLSCWQKTPPEATKKFKRQDSLYYDTCDEVSCCVLSVRTWM